MPFKDEILSTHKYAQVLVCIPKHTYTYILQMSENVSVLDKQSQQPTTELLKMCLVLTMYLVQFMCNIAWLTL